MARAQKKGDLWRGGRWYSARPSYYITEALAIHCGFSASHVCVFKSPSIGININRLAQLLSFSFQDKENAIVCCDIAVYNS